MSRMDQDGNDLDTGQDDRSDDLDVFQDDMTSVMISTLTRNGERSDDLDQI